MTQDILITPGSGEPQILFRGSGTNDTPIELNVLSSYQSASGSGTALLFEGQEGQLFAVTDNLSSGTIFSVGDITGLSMLSVDASGDVKLGEFANSVIVYPGLTLDDNVPSTTSNVLYNDGGDLMWNGVVVLASDAAQAINGSGTASYVARFTDSNTLSTGVLYDNGTNVGIGTTSPSEKLHVAGDVLIDGNGTTIAGATWDNGLLRIGTSSDGISIDSNEIYGSNNLHLGTLDTASTITFRHGTTERMRIASGGNVGIGTASPSEKLHVMGGTRLQGDSTNTTWTNASPTLAIKRSTSAPYISFHANTGARLGYLQLNSSTVNILNVETYNDFAFQTNNLERMRIHKDGYVNFSNYLRIDYTNDERGIVFEDSGGTDSIYMTVNDGQGNFNIMLGVNHDGDRIVTGDGLCKILFQGHSQGGEISLNAGPTGTAGASAVYNIGLSLDSDDQKLRIGNPNDNTGLDNQAGNIIADVDGDLITRYLRARDANGIQIGDDSDTLGIFVQDGGNVGIGTASPISPLHVLKTGGSTSGVNLALILNYESDAATIEGGGTAIEFRGKSSGGNIANYQQARIRSVGYNSNNSHGIAFDTRASGGVNLEEKVRIANNGNVGIGTTSPQRRLDLGTTGQMTFGNNVTVDGDQGIYWHSSDTYGIYRTPGNWAGNNYQQLMIKFSTGIVLDPGSGIYGKSHVGVVGGVSIGSSYYTTEFNNGLIVQGDVGIGTTSPSQKLHIIGNQRIENATDPKLEFHDGAAVGGYVKFDTSEDNLVLSHVDVAGDNQLVLANDGNVGIGTASPNAVLHAYGSTASGTVFNVEGTNGSLFSVVDNLSGVLMSVNNNAGLPVFEVYDDDSIIAGRFAQDDFVISSSGNVGIGTDTPAGKLHVVGEAQVDNLKLDGNTLSSTDTNGNIIIRPNGTGGIAGGAIATVTGPYAIVAGGCGNTASGNCSTVVGGRLNQSTGCVTTVGGGYANRSIGHSSTISGGYSNCAPGTCSFIGGGRDNCASGGSSTISGGCLNVASGAHSTVGGGGSTYAGNTASGCYSTVGGGDNNIASGGHSTVGGGGACLFGFLSFPNTASGLASTVSGGMKNTASGDCSTVSGGYNNEACGNSSVVGGGTFNTASCTGSTVSGGSANRACGPQSLVAGGRLNTASACYSTVIGGFRAKASRYGEVAHAAGRFAQNGDAQHSTFVARYNTTDATANVELFLDGNNNLSRMILPPETTWTFDIKLSAYNDTDNTTAWWIIRGGIRRNAANGTTLIGSLIEERDYEGTMSGTSAAVTADDTNESLKIAVTGLAGKNIRWVAVVDVAQVSWGTP